MSKDRLEEFIIENRDDLDTEIPGLNLWRDIDKKINPTPKKNIKKIAGRSAAVVVVLLVACCWFFTGESRIPQEARMNQSPSSQQLLIEANPELAEISEYFTRKINQNKGKLAALNHHDPALYRDLNHMEAMYDTLRIEWQMNPHKSDEKLVDAMIANFRTRSMLLENVVARIERHENSFTSARPAVYKEY
ncbi:MAG: hypothetical protein ACI94Y_000123 [Maribacter sp.]|jgi:hypothetical protein